MLRKGNSDCRGFTLVELLVALVILSVGLLGVANLQFRGMQANHNSYLQSQALQYAYEMLDMIRANRAAAIAGNYDINLGAAIPAPANTVAQQDVAEWLRSLTGVAGTGNISSGLPGGQGSIAVVAGNPATVRISIRWNENRFSDAVVNIGANDPPQVVVETKL